MKLIQVGTEVWVVEDIVLAVSKFHADKPTEILLRQDIGEAIPVRTDWTVEQVLKAINS